MKGFLQNRKIIFLLIIVLMFTIFVGCSKSLKLVELIELDTEELTEIKIYKRFHSSSKIFEKEEIKYLKLVELRDKAEIEKFLEDFKKITINDDPHIADRFNYDFNNNYIYVEMDDVKLIFVENEVIYDFHY